MAPAGRRLTLVLALAASAGIHAALVPAHAAGTPVVAALFAVSALALGGLAALVDRSDRRWPVPAAAQLLGSLLVIYAASRLVVVWPLPHVEPVDAIGAITKLLEAVGLGLALSLLHASQGSRRTLPFQREGARP